MRVNHGRGDWRPGVRIEGLLRYAFIGDSNVYGSGVAPDQTLPANAERQMNELVPAWPVEAVNFGAGGYNLWNSWLMFKQTPQVFDGLVLALCGNDADLFGRAYHVVYPEPEVTRWESTHPFGEAVVRCFDEMALFSQARSLPIALVYFNAYGNRNPMRIAEIVGGLCALRGFCFIDAFAHYRARNFAFADLMASAANFHPSAMAHEAIGRHLATTLKGRGWFARHGADGIDAAPDRIVAAAQVMVESDRYPPDAALNWALRVLDAKWRMARRMEASDGEFSTAANRAAEALTTANRRWHMANRVRVFVQGEGIDGGISHVLTRGEEERLRLEEMCFALGSGDWPRLSAHSLDGRIPQENAPGAGPSDAQDFLDRCIVDLQRIRDCLDGLRRLAAPAAVGWPHDEASILSDLDALARLTDRVLTECASQKATILRIQKIFGEVRPALPEASAAQVSGLIGDSLMRVKQAFRFIEYWSATFKGIHDDDRTGFTTIEVTLCADLPGGKPNVFLAGQTEYMVPNSRPFTDGGVFSPDGSPTLLKLHFPTFYAGRISFRPFIPKEANRPPMELKLIKVELYNRKSHRRAIDPATFYLDQRGRYVSPLVYLF